MARAPFSAIVVAVFLALTPLSASARPRTAASRFEHYNLDRVNAYRAAAGVPPLVLDPAVTDFAREGSLELSRDHVQHGHFIAAGDTIWHRGFKGYSSENQGAKTGWLRAANDPTENEKRQIDQILESMIHEGVHGGHYRNMMSPTAKRLGAGLVEDNEGKLYFTNDFSE